MAKVSDAYLFDIFDREGGGKDEVKMFRIKISFIAAGFVRRDSVLNSSNCY